MDDGNGSNNRHGGGAHFNVGTSKVGMVPSFAFVAGTSLLNILEPTANILEPTALFSSSGLLRLVAEGAPGNAAT